MAKTEVSRTYIFESMPPYKAVLSLAIPNIVNQLANVIYNLADTFFIGKLGSSSMVAALSITTSVVIILTAISNLFCVGSCAVIAAALGAKDRKKAEDVALLTPVIACITGAVVMIFVLLFRRQIALYSGASETSLVYTMDYQFWVLGLNAIPILVSTSMGAGMRGYGYSKYEMYGITLGNILNIILDPIFIFVFKLGVTGAGAATFLSTFVSLLFFLFMARRMQKKDHLYADFKSFRFNGKYIWQVVSTGFPAFLHSLLASVTNTYAMNIFKTYSDAAVAAIGITRKIEHTFGQVIIGLNQGIIPLISYNHAHKDYNRLKEVRNKALILGVIWGLIALVIIFPFAEQLVKVFINDPDTIRYGTPLVKMYAFICLTMGLNNNVRTVLQALGQKKQSSIFSILRQVVIYMPFLILLNKFFGLYGAAFTPLACDLVTDVIGLLIVRKVLLKVKAECETN